MTTYALGLPSELRDRLKRELPRQAGRYEPMILVVPRARGERRCPAYEADHYEINAFYVTMTLADLAPLEEALRAVPEVYLTTQVRQAADGNVFTNPYWPHALGQGRRGRDGLRPQVLAVIADDGQARAERLAQAKAAPRTNVYWHDS